MSRRGSLRRAHEDYAASQVVEVDTVATSSHTPEDTDFEDSVIAGAVTGDPIVGAVIGGSIIGGIIGGLF